MNGFMKSNVFRSLLFLLALAGFTRHTEAQELVVTELFDHARAIRVVNEHAFSVSESGLFIYDITDKTNPNFLSSVLINDNSSFDLEVSPPFAYVLSGERPSETTTLTVVNISNRRRPVIAGRFQGFQAGVAKDMILRTQTLYVAIENRLEIIDVSDPKNIRRRGTLQITNEKATIPVIVRDGSVLFVLFRHAKGSGIAAVQTSNPANPDIIARVNFPRKDSEDNRIFPISLAVSNHTLYVSRANLLVSIYDVTDPSEFKSSGTANIIASGLTAEGTILFAETSNETRLAIFETTNPITPRFVREVDWSGNTSAMVFDTVALQAYVQWEELGRLGLAILKLNNDGTFNIQSTRVAVVLSDVEEVDGITFTTGSNKLAAVQKVARKKQVTELGNIAFFEQLGGMQLSNDRVYVSTVDEEGTPGIRSVDVSDPAHMQELGFLELEPSEVPPAETQPRFDVEQNLLAIAFRREGLALYDVSGGSFQRVGTFDISPNERGLNVTIQGDTAYFCTSRSNQLNLYVIDVSNPAQPALTFKVSGFDTGALINDLIVDGNFLYATGVGKVVRQVKSSGKLYIFSLANPDRPVLLSKTFTGSNPVNRSGAAEEVRIQSDVAYVADGVDGVTVFNVANKSNPHLLRVINTPSYVRGIDVDSKNQIHAADLAAYLVFR